jgi:hypothetical protein
MRYSVPVVVQTDQPEPKPVVRATAQTNVNERHLNYASPVNRFKPVNTATPVNVENQRKGGCGCGASKKNTNYAQSNTKNYVK